MDPKASVLPTTPQLNSCMPYIVEEKDMEVSSTVDIQLTDWSKAPRIIQTLWGNKNVFYFLIYTFSTPVIL